MFIKDEDASQVLLTAVKACDADSLRNILHETQDLALPYIQNEGSLLHVICKANEYDFATDQNFGDSNFLDGRKLIIYMLIDAGADLEQIDNEGNTCLFYAVKNEDIYICDILLQCGADMWAKTELGISVHDYMNRLSSDGVKDIFEKYSPGLWRSVESEDIYQVRKLVNLWCRTDLSKDGVMLKDTALATGNEEIISLILGIFDSMKLVYHIFAKNTKAVKKLLEMNRQRIRLDLRKMSDKGAPILYYLIQSEDIATIELFVNHGCQLYTIMQDEFGFDMPVLYSALKSGTPVSVMEALLPPNKQHQEEMLYKILYRGQSVLEVALSQNVSLDVFNVLIDRGGPQLLCERNQVNQTVRDLAFSSGKTPYVEAIDMNISSWILHPWKYPGRRQKLALYGWNLESIEDELKENLYVDDYFLHYKPLQVQMKHLADAIEKGNMKAFLELKASLLESDESAIFVWHGRVVGDGMPHLHRAVLHNRLKMVELILAEKPPKESIDNLFDQYRRTALHYAYASDLMKGIKSLLMSYGCSEHVLDKVNREPLDFRDKQDTDDMMELLNRVKSKNFGSREVDPWRTREAEAAPPGCEHLGDDTESPLHSSDGESDFSDEEEETQTAKSCTLS